MTELKHFEVGFMYIYQMILLLVDKISYPLEEISNIRLVDEL